MSTWNMDVGCQPHPAAATFLLLPLNQHNTPLPQPSRSAHTLSPPPPLSP
jgi:hypothetical protein